MLKRDKNFLTALTLLTNIFSNNRIAASETMLIAQTLEKPLGNVPLLLRPVGIVLQYLIYDRSERIKLRPWADDTLLIARRNRMLQHLCNRAAVDAIM